MATVELAKPGTAGTAILQLIKSNALTESMRLKLQAADINYTQVVEDTTGGTNVVADTFHTHEGSGLLGGTIALQGLLVSTRTLAESGGGGSLAWIGIANMFSTDDTFCRMRWSVQLASGIYLRGSMIVETCRVRWIRTAATVQLTINGRITDTGRLDTEETAAFTA
jgi:hypothetical protein